ncbi:DUF397 domain-containing protein [Sphaerisporangium corydalis]|uniref:DUF397 domain-containing protein n=1 Tax=Sphaerisporangium corydalis TaxID=1441875 RepID=A0ABV9EKX8_9ACTN|nr:DUF397 domain-containing protein [Sphaerisporangium corydalis]
MRLSPATRYSDLAWRVARDCNTSNCVTVAVTDGMVAVRDSKNPDSPVLLYTESEWQAFINGAKNGEFDITSLSA